MTIDRRIACTIVALYMISVAQGAEYADRLRKQAAVEFLAKAEKRLDHHFNLRSDKGAATRRSLIASRVLSRHASSYGNGTKIGIDLLEEMFKQSDDKNVPPLWLLAGLCHHVTFGDAVDGRSFHYSRLLHSRGTVPDLRDLLVLGRKNLPNGCLELHSELCAVALKGLRAKSPVAVKRLIGLRKSSSPVQAMKETLGVKSDGDLQQWYTITFRKVVAKRVLTRREALEALDAAIVELGGDPEAADPMQRLRDISALDEDKAKAFAAEVLRLSGKMPPGLGASVNTLAATLLKKRDLAHWKTAVAACWKEMKQMNESLAVMETRLNVRDLKNRLDLAQRILENARKAETGVESTLSTALDRGDSPSEEPK